MADGRRLEEKINCSATVWPISTKFCILTHIGPPNPKHCSKNQIFKNPRWWTAAILKNVKCNIFATVWSILMKFGTRCIFAILNWWATKSLQISKFKMAYGGHLENQKFGILPKPFGWFLLKFCTLTRINPPELTSCLTRSSAIADGPRNAIVSTNPADTWRRHIPQLT